MATAWTEGGKRRFRVMAGVSLCVHVLGLGLWGLQEPGAPRGAEAALEQPDTELEIEMLDRAQEGDPGEDFPMGATAASPAAVEAHGRAGPTPGTSGPANAEAVVADEASTAEGVPAAGDEAVASSGRPRLSLDQLGVGQSHFVPGAVVDRRGGAPQRKRDIDYSARLSNDMTALIAKDDQKKGLGPEGPVITQILATAYAGTVPYNANARLAVTADGEGKVVSVQVLSTDGAPEQWDKLAREVLAKLQSKRLRVMGKRGFRFTVKVSSRNQLPSGADPGVNASVLGVPISKGQGPRSTRVDLLDPTNPGNIMGLAGDLADIGAVARRVVRAHLESLDIFQPPAVKAAD